MPVSFRLRLKVSISSSVNGFDAQCRDDLVKIWIHSQPTRLPRISASPTSPAIDMCAPSIGRRGLPVFAIVRCRTFHRLGGRERIAILYALARDAYRWILHYSCESRSLY